MSDKRTWMTALPSEADIQLRLLLRAANDPKRTLLGREYRPVMLTVRQTDNLLLHLSNCNDKAIPA